jgi:hypothetical protein
LMVASFMSIKHFGILKGVGGPCNLSQQRMFPLFSSISSSQKCEKLFHHWDLDIYYYRFPCSKCSTFINVQRRMLKVSLKHFC